MMICSTDSNFVALAIGLFEQLHTAQLWVNMGVLKQLRFISAHRVHAGWLIGPPGVHI